MPVHIKLYGSKGNRFESIKGELSNRLGYEPSNPEVLGILMSGYSLDDESEQSALYADNRLTR